jgi:hypothetical protein
MPPWVFRAPKIMRFTTETQEYTEVKSFESAIGGFKDFILRDLRASVVIHIFRLS